MNKINLLTCPNCEGQFFNQIECGTFESAQVNFKIPLKPTESKVVYLCINEDCGYIIDSFKEPIKLLVIITGNSSGYKRRGIRDAGLEEFVEHMDFEWQDFISPCPGPAIIWFITKDARKNKWDKLTKEIIPRCVLQELNFSEYIIQELDISDGKYDPEELKKIVTQYMD